MGLFYFMTKFWSLRWYVCVYCAEGTGLFVAWSAGAGRFLWTRKKVFIKITVHWLQWNPLLLLHLLPLVLVIIAKEQETERVDLWTEREKNENQTQKKKKKKKIVNENLGGGFWSCIPVLPLDKFCNDDDILKVFLSCFLVWSQRSLIFNLLVPTMTLSLPFLNLVWWCFGFCP